MIYLVFRLLISLFSYYFISQFTYYFISQISYYFIPQLNEKVNFWSYLLTSCPVQNGREGGHLLQSRQHSERNSRHHQPRGASGRDLLQQCQKVQPGFQQRHRLRRKGRLSRRGQSSHHRHQRTIWFKVGTAVEGLKKWLIFLAMNMHPFLRSPGKHHLTKDLGSREFKTSQVNH